MPRLKFLKDQVLVTKGRDPRTGQKSLVQCVFVEYLPVPDAYGADCVIKDQNNDHTKVKSDDLANVMHAEAVLAERQQRAQGFQGFGF